MIRRAMLGLTVAACLDPTEITIGLSTNFACSDFGTARIRVGSSMTETSTCAPDGTIGTLVVVPGASVDGEVDIRVTGAVREGGNAPPSLDLCEAQNQNGGGCVTTSRALHLILHRSLSLPIMIDSRCANVPCGAGTTCIAGVCTPVACNVGSSNVVTCQPDDAGAPDAGNDAPIAAIKVVDLAAHTDGTCAVLSTGEVICWGGNAGSRFGDHGGATVVATPSAVSGVTGATRVALGASFACAVFQDGHVGCWGDDTQGQLGDGKTTSRPTPQAIAFATVAPFDDVYAGAAHACAHTTFPDAKIVCWGANASAQLGRPASAFSATPAAIAGNFTFFSGCTGTSHTCAVGNTNGGPTTDNVYCWGSSVGAFGTNGSSTGTPTVISGMPLPDEIDCGESFTISAMPDTPYGTGTWGDNTYGQTNPAKLGTSPLAPAIGVAQYLLPITAGGKLACGVAVAGNEVTCWGDDSLGELGPNASGAGPSTISVDGTVKMLAAGSTHVCAVTITPATDEVWCWGDGAAAPKRMLP